MIDRNWTRRLLFLWIMMIAVLLSGCSEEKSINESSEITIIVEEQPIAENQIPEQTVLMGVDLSYKTKEEAIELLRAALDDQLSNTYTLTDEDKKWTYTAKELGATFDYQTAVEELLDSEIKPETVPIKVDPVSLNSVLRSLISEIEQKSVDATMEFKAGEFIISEETNGRSLNVTKSAEELNASMESGAFLSGPVTLKLTVDVTPPKTTAASLKDATQIIGEYETYYSEYEESRSTNLKVASAKINGTVLQPGEMFSFNDSTAPMTEEGGYEYAPIISGGEYIPGIGGGVCQVSTTLYNAVLLAELEVNERWCHAFPPSYCQMGLDSTVYEEVLDFCFTNDTDSPIYIEMWCDDGECGCRLYGKEIHDPSREIEFYYEIVGTIDKPEPKKVEDPEMEVGEEEIIEYGHIGYVVETYKTVTENGNSVTEWFSESIYDNSPDKIKVGTKPKEGTESSAPTEESSEASENTESSMTGEESEETSVIEESSEPEESSTEESSEEIPGEESTESSTEEETGETDDESTEESTEENPGE
ncbi:MAG: VanW family protein [Firmicutes bacterium]|nr:VanW family protein [Bacillota bacterium]